MCVFMKLSTNLYVYLYTNPNLGHVDCTYLNHTQETLSPAYVSPMHVRAPGQLSAAVVTHEEQKHSILSHMH